MSTSGVIKGELIRVRTAVGTSSPSNSGLQNTEFQTITVTPGAGSVLYVGALIGGVFKSSNATTFGSKMNDQSNAVGDRVGSRVEIEKVLDELMIIRRNLDPIMRNKYADDAATLAEWTRASHIERTAKKKKIMKVRLKSTPAPA